MRSRLNFQNFGDPKRRSGGEDCRSLQSSQSFRVRCGPALLLRAVLFALCLGGMQASAQELKVDKHLLSNGLTVYTQEDHSAPLISFHIFYKVGSVNERLGITGISHLFEHMMFNGSEHYEPKEFDRQLEAAGGSSNGYTDRDMTAYMETFPPEALDLVLDLESDRMASLRITDENIEQERGIVKEERRLRTDNDNEGKVDELLYLAAFHTHPYRNPVVGFMKDLNNITREDTQRYFDTYYTPNNAIAVVSGDFDTAELARKMEAAFGRVKRGPEAPLPYQFEAQQEGERRVRLIRDAELPMYMMAFHAPGAENEKDVVAMDLLQTLLSFGESSRLHQSLVYSKEVASDVSCWYQILRGPSLFTLVVQGVKGKGIEEAEAAALKELRRLQTELVGDAELRKAKKQLRASSLRALKTVGGRANEIGSHAVTFGSPDALKRLIDGREKVTAEEVRRVARTYLKPDQRTVVTLIPRSEAQDAPSPGDRNEEEK